MTAPTLSVAELARQFELATAAAALGEPWAPYTGEIEDGGKCCFIREHKLGNEDGEAGMQPEEVEEARADIDEAFCKTFNPQTVLALLAAAQRLARLESALEFLNARNFDGHGWRPGGIVDLAERVGWRFPEGGSDANQER